MLIAFENQRANLLTTSKNRLLAEANHLIHYSENSHESLMAIDPTLQEGGSYSEQLAEWTIGLFLLPLVSFITKLVQLLVNPK